MLMVKLPVGFNHLEKYEFVNGKDYPIYLMEHKKNVPNHQPESLLWVILSVNNIYIYINIYIYKSKIWDGI